MANRTEFHTEDNIYRVVPAEQSTGYSISVYNKNMSAWIGERGWYKTKKLAIEAAKDAAMPRTHNPAKRIGAAHPKRRSAATHAAPTARLVRRRKANVKQGYFPNPVPASKKVQIRNASKLYSDFTGHEATEYEMVDKPVIHDVMLLVGDVDGILYTTVRDGKTEKYIHKFKAASRPLFTVSHDGKQLYMLGGSYDFTELGIVDKT